MHTRSLTWSAIAIDMLAFAGGFTSEALAALPCGSPLAALAAWFAWRALRAARAEYGLGRSEATAWGLVLCALYPLALVACALAPDGTPVGTAALYLHCFPLTQALALVVFDLMLGAWVLPRGTSRATL